MFFLPYSFRIVLVSVLLGSYFRAKSVGSERKCFLVEGKVLCYFSPNATSIYSWEEALKQCKDNEATLPDLPNEVIAGVLERYLESQNADYRFWTSGRRIESQEWRWINGQYYNRSDIVKRHDADSQAVVRNDLRYLEQHPTYEKNYVCQHFGLKCQSGGAIELSEGCLVLISRERRNVFHARNSCLESGGDLPVIRNKEDLQKFQEVFWELKDHAQIWIGLRRHWWIWNRANDSADIRFSSWADREGGRLYKNCMVVDSVRFEWIQVDCSDRESVLCQSVTPKKALHENDDTSSSMGGLVAGIIIGILIMSVAVVIAVLILRKRIRLPFDGFNRVKCVDSPMAKSHETEELHTALSSNANAATSRVDQGHYAGLSQGRNPETSRRHYDKLNPRQIENRQSHNIEPFQRQRVNPSQSRKSEPCPGYKYEPSESQCTEQGIGHRVEPPQSHNVPQHHSHKVEPNQEYIVEPCEGQGNGVFQGQKEDKDQDHYAKIGTDVTADVNDYDEQPKAIVYAKLEFDADASRDLASNDQNSPSETQLSPTEGSRTSKMSQQTSIRSFTEPERISTEVDARGDATILQNCA